MTRWLHGIAMEVPESFYFTLIRHQTASKVVFLECLALGSVAAGFLCRALITVKPQPKANKDFFNYLGSHFNTQNSMTSWCQFLKR